jgi:hypothetical protein
MPVPPGSGGVRKIMQDTATFGVDSAIQTLHVNNRLVCISLEAQDSLSL